MLTCLKRMLSLLLPQQPHRVGVQPRFELPAGSHRPQRPRSAAGTVWLCPGHPSCAGAQTSLGEWDELSPQ